MLPADYPSVVLEGVRALRQVATELRARAAVAPRATSHLLALRAASGLADRLEGVSGWEWRGGFAGLVVVPQDMAVLRDLAADERSPYRDAPPSAPPGRAAALDALARFLGRYLAHEFAFEDAPAAVPPHRSAPASERGATVDGVRRAEPAPPQASPQANRISPVWPCHRVLLSRRSRRRGDASPRS